jgi:enoyl-CoA hydratase
VLQSRAVKTLRIERNGALAVLRLDKPRGNAIDEELLQDLRAACAELALDAELRGVLLASAHPKLFCPGLDLVALVGYDRAAMQRFMAAFSQTVRALFALPRPVVAAVSGHAVAGGCILALCADVRLLRRGAQIGLNEVKVGVPLPWEVAVLLRHSVAPQALARVALLGRNFQDAEAVETGLAHASLEPDGFEAKCLEQLAEFVDKHPGAVAATKRALRAGALAEMAAREAEERAGWLDAWFSPETRARIEQIVGSLSR